MELDYTLRFPRPHTHYAELDLHICECTEKSLSLKLPVWTPGSYLVREFARHIDLVELETGAGLWERVRKVDKHTWQVETGGRSALRLRYRLYCFDWSVRTNMVDDDHAFLNGAATFLYAAGYEKIPVTIRIDAPANWNRVSTSLPCVDGNIFIRQARDLDELVDSPIETGSHESYFFEAAGVKHELAMYSSSNADIDKLQRDLTAIIEEETAIFGSHPCTEYLFIIHHSESSFGGLEHLHSSVNHITRRHYEGKKYRQAISLLAHEYFHLWNVKRIRPAELAKYNYDEETYTELLWFFEGVTSYYDDLVCCRAGIFSREDYLEIVSDNLNRVLNTPGIQVQTLAEASFDTWIKYYRQHEHSHNNQVSYYTKGGIVAMLLDFILLDASEGRYSYDDVLRALYEAYQQDPSQGITEWQVRELMESFSGLDLRETFLKYLHRTEALDPAPVFEKLGLVLSDTTDRSKAWNGLHIRKQENKYYVAKLDRGFSAYDSGLQVNDEIISIDGIEVMEAPDAILNGKQPGSTVQLEVFRQGLQRSITMAISADTRYNYRIDIPAALTERQQQLLEKWLGSRNAV